MSVQPIVVKHAVSLGSSCHTASFLKSNQFKSCSYPFDWVMGGPEVVLDALEDSFAKFLDQSLYSVFTDNTRCGHKNYGYRFFNHKYPLGNKDYAYYTRCVERFYKLLELSDPKLFIITNVQHDRNPTKHNRETDIACINKIVEKLAQLTTNFYIIYINPIHIQDPLVYDQHLLNNTICSIERSRDTENMIVVDMYCKSTSDGVRFRCADDNIMYKKIILDLFDLQL